MPQFSLQPTVRAVRPTINPCQRGSADEEKPLRRAIPAAYLPEFEIALQTGMRLSEQYRLRRDAIDLKAGTLTVPLSNTAKRAASRSIRRRRAPSETLQAPGGASEWAMVNEMGGRIIIQRRLFETAVETAKPTNFTWHCLRHTFASRLVMLGVDLRTVQVDGPQGHSHDVPRRAPGAGALARVDREARRLRSGTRETNWHQS